VIGGGDFSPDRVVPDILRSLLAGQPARLRNPGADGLAGAWNFGPESGDAIPVSELTEQMLRAWGDGSWIDATVAWYKAAERGANRDEVTREQIASFTVRAKALGQRWAGAAR
jgi:CDP-glucose 4,6-dehydratase